MPIIGVTGGIASGKSTVTQMLVEGFRENGAERIQAFSADEYGHELLEKDPEVRAEIQRAFGNAVIEENGNVSRGKIRSIIFSDPAARRALEVILHPKIHNQWRTESQSYLLPRQYFVAEIPLLYETNSAPYFDCIVVVEADVEVQLQRLSSKRGWSLETARQVIKAQMSAAEKMRRADILILNQHTEKLLHRQIDLAVHALLLRYA